MAVEAPVIGYRAWDTISGALGAIAVPARWQPGINRAFCLQLGPTTPLDTRHDSPDAGCTCGFYVYHGPAMAREIPRRGAGRAWGAVLAWGKIVRHGQEGFRAEFARPICLAQPEPGERTVLLTQCLRPIAILPFVPPNATWPISILDAVTGRTRAARLENGHCFLDGEAHCLSCGAPVPPPEQFAALLASRVRLAQTLGLPLVPAESIERYAAEYGRSIQDL